MHHFAFLVFLDHRDVFDVAGDLHRADGDALAARMGVGSSYVGRHLNLALLAPDIVAAIPMGREPDGLSLEKLYRSPIVWEEQRGQLE